MLTRKCPYCEKQNDPAAKFCFACGAVMHLAPCPSCGATNHINMDKCYRCGEALPGPLLVDEEGQFSGREAAAIPPEGASPDAPSVEAEHSTGPVPAGAPVPATPAARAVQAKVETSGEGHPSLAVMFIIIVSFVVAGVVAYRHKGSATPGEPIAQKPQPGAATAAPPVAETPAPAPVAAEPAKTEPAKTEPGTPDATAKSGTAPSAEALPATDKPAPAPARAKPAPPAAPRPAPAPPKPDPACTEAVAALGLCKQAGK
ncbi:MAG TPA: zinc ribbon domain-containing protein [Usitatibacteraceae bacterium]|nr:zinc ribbon domain-containing protein [Usitatibacteraceae bacterium]